MTEFELSSGQPGGVVATLARVVVLQLGHQRQKNVRGLHLSPLGKGQAGRCLKGINGLASSTFSGKCLNSKSKSLNV